MNNNNMYALCFVAGLLLIGIILCATMNKDEQYEVPKRILRYGNYHFNDHGFGAHVYQTDWTRGAFFQPFVPLDQGLYTSSTEWSPRYIRHSQQNYVSCCKK